MEKSPTPPCRPAGACLLICCCLLAAEAPAERVLLRFDEPFDLSAVEARDVRLSRRAAALRLDTGHQVDWPGITLKAPGGRWDLSAFAHLAMDLKNVGPNRVEVFCRVDSPGAAGEAQDSLTEKVTLTPGGQKVLLIPLKARIPPPLRSRLFGMRGYPGGWSDREGIDPARVTQLLVFVHKPAADHAFEIAAVRAGGSRPASIPAEADRLFPMIDRYGQFIHKDWPGKTRSVEDLAARKQAEAADLAKHPGPDGWNRYGGWQAGPLLEAAGRFRVAKQDGRWWLVDPRGRLFWSHGADCVRWTTGSTPISDRRHWFLDLPGKDSPFGPFYGRSGWAPHGYYRDRSYETYNFTGANLLRKYGPAWKQEFAALSHRRLRSWGMNTIANWSDAEIYLGRKTPYTVNVHVASKKLEGSQGYWGKFPDVFDPGFREALRRGLAAHRQTSAGDPWCLGYFLDNELSWGDERSLAVATLASPPDQPAKQVFLEDLQKKYGTVGRLNEAWNTAHASWDALRQSQTPPEGKGAGDDLAAFYTRTAEQYFRTCREAVKEVDPEGLYLGCRFAWVNDRAVRAAAKYCDVVSFNRYADGVADFRLPPGVDKPVVIGEFHFGALDRGMFHTGLRPVADQQARAAAYRSYVRGALANPVIVGTHWFQFGDQATTGRGDGENYQIGLLDVCDTPYPETAEACREVGYHMYRYRRGRGKP